MALQIANPVVVAKVERLARATGLSKTAVVEKAIDRLAGETAAAADPAERMSALLSQKRRGLTAIGLTKTTKFCHHFFKRCTASDQLFP